MNDKKYSIGFVIVGLAVLMLVSGAYQISYHAVEERAREEKAQTVKIQKQEESVAAEGEAMKNYCYYLLEKNGYVVVYLSDRETIYEYTSIDVETHPDTVQNEVKNGK